MTKKAAYPYIEAWGSMMGSNRTYIWEQVQKARADHAPHDAIYWNIDQKKWARFADVTRFDTRRVIESTVAVQPQ